MAGLRGGLLQARGAPAVSHGPSEQGWFTHFYLPCSVQTCLKGLPLELSKSAEGKEMKNEHELSAQPGGGEGRGGGF